jgi:hypothetical protein
MWNLIRELLFWFLMTSPMMAWKKNQPGCPCCETTCQFFSDDFAVDDLATNYTSVSGSWAISSGNLHTASSSAVLTGSTANPNSNANTKVSVTVNIATSGDIARIILNYQNSSNYWFAELKAGTGAYLRIYQRSGGSNTQKATVSITLANGGVLCASILNGTQIVTSILDDVNAKQSLVADGTFTQTGYGLGTGTLSGSVTFDSLSVGITSSDCPACEGCTFCDVGSDPTEFELVISGVTNQLCSSCSAYNATYILQFIRGDGGDLNAGFANYCLWEVAPSSDPCSIAAVAQIDIHGLGDPDAQLFARFLNKVITDPTTVSTVAWGAPGGPIAPIDLGAQPAACRVTALASTSTLDLTTACAFGSSTATITAL